MKYIISNDSVGKRVPEQMLQYALRSIYTAKHVMRDAQQMDTCIMYRISAIRYELTLKFLLQNSEKSEINDWFRFIF